MKKIYNRNGEQPPPPPLRKAEYIRYINMITEKDLIPTLPLLGLRTRESADASPHEGTQRGG